MLDRLKRFFEFSAKTGIYFPAAYDAISEGPSVTLLLVHVSSYLAIISIAALMSKDVLSGTIAAIAYSVLMLIFYMLRKLTNAKFDLDDQSLELSNNESNNK